MTTATAEKPVKTALEYTFHYFNGLITGWWLVLDPANENSEKILKKHFSKTLSYETKLAMLQKGETLCVNAWGGYHFLTDKHIKLTEIIRNKLNFPVRIPS